MTEIPRVLLVDDSEAFLSQFIPILCDGMDCDVIPVTSARTALELMLIRPVDLIVSDMQMPGMSGLELFRKAQELHPDIPVILITAFGCVEEAIQAVKLGAFHYFEKPVMDKVELILSTMREALIKRKMQKSIEALERGKSLNAPPVEIVGQSAAIREVRKSIDEIAGVPVTVLITGETGTGKDLVARAIHASSQRRRGPFVHVNCAELAEGVLESELFGHERGSFTDACKWRKGLFELADRGTIFLDEISEASVAMQAKLLRVIDTNTFTRVGGAVAVRSDFRVLAATNRDLQEMIADGAFRPDLFYRLNVYTVTLPPLRHHREDIPVLADHYLRKYNEAYSRQIEGFSAQALLLLREYHWPGNVRELVNVVERAVIACEDRVIALKHLPFHTKCGDFSRASALSLKDLEKFVIRLALERSNGNRVEASALLGISHGTLTEKLRVHGLDGIR